VSRLFQLRQLVDPQFIEVDLDHIVDHVLDLRDFVQSAFEQLTLHDRPDIGHITMTMVPCAQPDQLGDGQDYFVEYVKIVVRLKVLLDQISEKTLRPS